MATNEKLPEKLTRGGTAITSTASWEKNITQDNKTTTYHFPTQGKYVDQNIDLKVTAKTGRVGLDISGTKTYTPVIKTTATTATGATNIKTANAQTTTAPTSGYFISVQSEANTGTVTPTATVIPGWVTDNEMNVTAESTVGADQSAVTYITIPTAQTNTNNAGTNVGTVTASTETQYINITEGYTPARKWTINPLSSVTQATVTNTATLPSGKTDSAGEGKLILASGEYLKITAGYVREDLYYSLAGLVPDGANIAASGSSPYILNAKTAYDKDGNLITGGIQNLSPSTTYFTKTTGTTAGTGLSEAKITSGFYVNEDWYVKRGSLTLGGSAPSIKSSSTTATEGAGVTISDTDTDPGTGVYFTTGGKAVATRGAVTYTGTAGWITPAAGGTTLGGATDSNETNLSTNKYYITKITVPKDKKFTLETTADTALDTASDVTITNNAFRQLKITNNANGDINIDNKGQVDITSKATAASGSTRVSGTDNVTVNAFAEVTSTSLAGAQQIIKNGVWESHTIGDGPDGPNGPEVYYGRTVIKRADIPVDNGTILTGATASQKNGSVDTNAWKYNIPIEITGASITFKAKGGAHSGYISSDTKDNVGVSITNTGLSVAVGNAQINLYDGTFTYD